ncbi:alpha/beta hydrolase [Halomonas sp. HNIBRBA4712]|uniref:alpha/beta hydrolase n=1 Tax=Halomonas sp. HNIBRBA4712 TaxID=3373087 RepID=UPI003745217D
MAAKRDPTRLMGRTVFDDPPAQYQVERFVIECPAHPRRWRITLATPRLSAPTEGFDAFWMLDGNAAMMTFDPAQLSALADGPAPPVLIFVSHDSDLRTDPARWRDYPFSVLPEDEPLPTPYRGGGADILLDTLKRQACPAIAKRVALSQRHTLWGHSLGGLFALYTLYTRPGAFTTYAAASPSLWWHEGALLGRLERDFLARSASPARLRLTLGGGERHRDDRQRDLGDPRVRAHLRRVASVPRDATLQLAERLRHSPELEVSYREFPGLTHGDTLRASLLDALERVTGTELPA